jgi:hypothetical protein
VPVPMIDTRPDYMRVRIDLIASALKTMARPADHARVGVETYRTKHLEGRPEFVVMVDGFDVARFVGALVFECVKHGLERECRDLLEDAHMTQAARTDLTVLSFDGWTLVNGLGLPITSEFAKPRPARRGR